MPDDFSVYSSLLTDRRRFRISRRHLMFPDEHCTPYCNGNDYRFAVVRGSFGNLVRVVRYLVQDLFSSSTAFGGSDRSSRVHPLTLLRPSSRNTFFLCSITQYLIIATSILCLIMISGTILLFPFSFLPVSVWHLLYFDLGLPKVYHYRLHWIARFALFQTATIIPPSLQRTVLALSFLGPRPSVCIWLLVFPFVLFFLLKKVARSIVSGLGPPVL